MFQLQTILQLSVRSSHPGNGTLQSDGTSQGVADSDTRKVEALNNSNWPALQLPANMLLHSLHFLFVLIILHFQFQLIPASLLLLSITVTPVCTF
jgi:hypothetical protein